MKTRKYTWEELVNLKDGTVVYVDAMKSPKFMIRKGHACLCGYVGFPKDHPIVKQSDIALDKLDVHGGLTFDGQFPAKHLISEEVNEKLAKELASYHWFGWDYAHFGDYFMFYDKPEMKAIFDDLHKHCDEKKWNVEDIIEDSMPGIIKFNNYLKKNYRLLQAKNWINRVLRRKQCRKI